MNLKINADMLAKLEDLKRVFEENEGETTIYFDMDLRDIEKTVNLEVQNPKGVNLQAQLFEGLHQIYGNMDFIKITKGT